MKTFFITGSGTEVGKTYVTCALTRALLKAGKTVAAVKPVISGYEEDNLANSDSGQILSALGSPIIAGNAGKISPWRFKAPCSPDMAAIREKREIDFDSLVAWCLQEKEDLHFRLIEGVGGVLVPLNKYQTVLDWMKRLGHPVLLVGGSYLGTVSHTLTSLYVLRSVGLEIPAIIISESAVQPVPLVETIETLKRFCGEVRVLGLKRDENASELATLLGWIH